jgi:hypothetical protein
LITALLLCSIISLIILPSYIMLSKTAVRQSQRAMFNVAAVDLAETGLEHAIWAHNNENISPSVWTDWSLENGSYRRTFSGFDYNSGVTGKVNVAVLDPGTANPTAIAKASITLQDGQEIEKWARATFRRSQGEMQGLVLSGSLSLSGGSTQVDSWNSVTSLIYSIGKRTSNAKVATTSKVPAAVSGSAASFYGSLRVGADDGVSPSFASSPYPAPVVKNYSAPEPTPVSMPADGVIFTWGVKPNAAIYLDTSATYTGSPMEPLKSIIRGQAIPNSNPYTEITNTNGYIPEDLTFLLGNRAPATTIGATGENRIYRMSSLWIRENNPVTIKGNVELLLLSSKTALIIERGTTIKLDPNATLTIYTPGHIYIQGSGFVNNLAPTNLKIFGTSETTQTFHWFENTGKAASIMHGVVYAPNANISFSGGDVQFSGAMTARSLNIQNAGLHFDESLYGFNPPNRASARSYAEFDTPASRAAYLDLMNF